MQPGAAPGPSGARPNLADQARRSTLIAYGGRDLGGETSQGPAAASSAQPTENSGTPGSTAGGAPNALDLPRQSSAVGEARAPIHPHRTFLNTPGTLYPE